MNQENQKGNDDLRDLLKQSMPSASHGELRRDLWPQMLEKLARELAPSVSGLSHGGFVSWPRVHWFDWLLAAVAGAAVLLFPNIIPALFYHL
jgi:hypothetical protein